MCQRHFAAGVGPLPGDRFVLQGAEQSIHPFLWLVCQLHFEAVAGLLVGDRFALLGEEMKTLHAHVLVR